MPSSCKRIAASCTLRTHLDAAAAQGIYVHLDVCELVSKIVGHNPGQPAANDTVVWTQLQTVVLAARRHPALLAWYIADDTVNWFHDPLAKVYRSIKAWDPVRQPDRHPILCRAHVSSR